MNYIDKKVSVKRAISILSKNGIQVDDKEALTIIDFLYLMAKNYRIFKEGQISKSKGEIEP